jgi:hypothetical protein
MKKLIRLFSICAFMAVFLIGCNEKPAPLKAGVLWSVRWIESSTAKSVSTSGLYRTDQMNPLLGGSYGQDMYGVLYPTCLEVRFVGSKDSHAQIIPMSQIVWLEFGDGGVSIAKH